ncbi:hypothetical protein KPH14_012831 [Odynerus spinipes]|uniref:Uncharacterized protein n=1 Tax=Odynerus spinipes TaxID=1348599 RepID=A0AAD9RDB2_9HYME|nr:hypothetical protein KPH14_012831 [Odynerus spinipes]
MLQKEARNYGDDELVAVKRTQLGPGLKLSAKYLGPYRIAKVLKNNRYIVEKIGDYEGPQRTSTVADHMKPWVEADSDESDEESDVDEGAP